MTRLDRIVIRCLAAAILVLPMLAAVLMGNH
jgi:hypothetical protein